MSLSAVDCVQPAIQHTRQQLFAKFRFPQWSRLALVGILAGELHVGGCGFGNLGQLASQRPRPSQEFVAAPFPFPHLDPARIAQFAGLIAAIVIFAIVFSIVFLYINSVFRFILFESVLRRECSFSTGWQRWHRAGRRYFLWQLVLMFSTWIFMGVVIGIPLLLFGASGWIKNSSHHIAGLAGGVILLIGAALICALIVAVIQMLAKDFLVPIMALEDLDFADGWSRLIGLLRVEPGKFAVYLLLKITLAIAAGILFTIVAVIPALVVIIPSVVVVIAGAAAGLTWNVVTVSLAVICGSAALFVLFYLVAVVCVPATVFFGLRHVFLQRPLSEPGCSAQLTPAPPAPEASPLPNAPPPPTAIATLA